MTLIIACLLLRLIGAAEPWYGVVALVWLGHLAFHSKIRLID